MGRWVRFDMSRVQVFTNSYRLDEEPVRDLVGRCTCPVQFPMVKVGEGIYQVGESPALVFVRVLRNHVMVRVGGGWDTLENYLNKYDPCRCQFHKGHRSGASDASAVRHKRWSSTTSLMASRASTASPLPTTPTTSQKTPSLASASPSQSGLKGCYSEHASFTKGLPSPSRTAQVPTSRSFHKGLSPGRSSSPGPGQADLLTLGRSPGQGLVAGILKKLLSYLVCGCTSAELEGVRRLPTSATSQSLKEMESRESSVGRDSVRVSSCQSQESSLLHAGSVCSFFASCLPGKKPVSGGGASNILARRTPPRSPSMGSRNPSERPKTPSTAERPETPVLTPRPKTPTASSSRSKIPVASIQPEVKDSASRPQTSSCPKTRTAVSNHSNVGSSSNAGAGTPLVRASSADAGYSKTTTVHVNSNTVASVIVTCTDAPSYMENNIPISSPDCRVKNSSSVHTSVESSNFGHTQVTNTTLQPQFYLSSSDNERKKSESWKTAEEGNQKQTVPVSVSRNTAPVSSRIPKPSFIPRATTPVSTSCSVSKEPGRCNGSLVARGGRTRPSAHAGRSSVERRLSAENGDGEKQPTTPRTPRRRPQTPNYSGSSAVEGNPVRRAQTGPGLENSSPLASFVIRNLRPTTPGPEISSSKTKTNLDFVTLRRDSRPSLNEKNGSTPRAVSTNARPQLQKQKPCDPEVLMISRNSQGLHRVYIPDQNEVSASPQTRRKLQPSASLDVDRMRSRTPWSMEAAMHSPKACPASPERIRHLLHNGQQNTSPSRFHASRS